MSEVQLQTAVSAVDLMLTFNHISRPHDHQSHAHVQSLWGQLRYHNNFRDVDDLVSTHWLLNLYRIGYGSNARRCWWSWHIMNNYDNYTLHIKWPHMKVHS